MISSAARIDPGSARQLFEQYRDKIPGLALPAIEREIKIANNAKRAEEEHARAEAARQRKEQADLATDQYVSSIIAGRGVNMSKVLSDPRLAGEPHMKILIANMLDKAGKGETDAAISRHNTVADYQKIMSGDWTDETNLNMGFAAGRYTRADFDWLRKQFQDMRTTDGQKLGTARDKFEQSVKGSITRSTQFSSFPPEDAEFYRFTQYVDRKIQEARQNKEDPYALFDPQSPKYLGTAASLSPFQQTMQEGLSKNVGKMKRKSKEYTSAEEVQADLNNRLISYEQAVKILKEKQFPLPPRAGSGE